jgi:beta-lactamase regulating signal transducer with metallopeptidase domain
MIPIPIEIVLKATVVLTAAGLAASAMRHRASAASRHFVWTLAAAGVLVLPVAALALPRWPISVRSGTIVADGAVALDAVAEVEHPIDIAGTAASGGGGAADPRRPRRDGGGSPIAWVGLLSIAYGAGVALLLARLGVERWRTRRLLVRTTPVHDADWTRLLDACVARLAVGRSVHLARSWDETMPMTSGVRRPVVVVPSIADTWDEDRRRTVLLHELAHVARFDCFTQTLGEVAVALYWVHPGAWWMARQLRVERELACDDCVLTSGTDPRTYAEHLLEIAHTLGARRAPALAVSMARPRELERRMLAMLDQTRHRATPGTGRRMVARLLAGAAIVALAAATPVAVGSPQTAASATPPTQAAAPAQDQSPSSAPSAPVGSWQIRLASDRRHAQLAVSVGEHSSHSATIPLERVEGLAAILTGPGGPARHRLAREAGTFDFEGTVRSGVGGGTFSFTPSVTFSDALVKRGFARPTVVELGTLAWADIGFAFIDELEAQHYARPTLPQLMNGAQHGVNTAYVKDLAGLGYRLGSIDALVRLRDHGVDAGFARDLLALGLPGLTADDLVRARDHGVDPDFIRSLRALGYTGVPMADLIAARDHGVDSRYVRALREMGYQITLDELKAARDHGVGPEYVREMAAAGYPHPSIAELIRLRDHGVSAKTVQDLKNRGVDRPTIDRLIQLHDRGESAEDSRAAATRRTQEYVVDLLRAWLQEIQRRLN